MIAEACYYWLRCLRSCYFRHSTNLKKAFEDSAAFCFFLAFANPVCAETWFCIYSLVFWRGRGCWWDRPEVLGALIAIFNFYLYAAGLRVDWRASGISASPPFHLLANTANSCEEVFAYRGYNLKMTLPQTSSRVHLHLLAADGQLAAHNRNEFH